MQQLVSITSQGQITIPASMRRVLMLEEYNKALVQRDKNRIIIEPIPNILKLGGFLKSKAKKDKPIDQIIGLEEKIIAKSLAKKYRKKK